MKLLLGDCIASMKTLPDNSVDSIVTDPPYELGFMGKSWDSTGIANSVEMWREALRVLKPGAHLLAFSGSRTYHRMACAIEDAGFEIRDQIMWVYGSGFPKSHNVSKGIDKAAGAVREVVGNYTRGAAMHPGNEGQDNWRENYTGEVSITAPATPAAKQWDGWGTALKPAHEPIVLARKPLIGTVANNVLTYGTGGLNIDGARVGFISDADRKESTDKNQHEVFGTKPMTGNNTYGDYSMVQPKNYDPVGRFPANFIHDGSDEVVDLLGEPARFFYCAKTSKRDRNEGLEGFEVKRPDTRSKTGMGTFDEKGVAAQTNHHPTVKPTDLMRYLCRLITPPNGTVLDPFMGSGSTGKGAVLEGFDFIGCEMEPEYLEIARARIEFVNQEPTQDFLL